MGETNDRRALKDAQKRKISSFPASKIDIFFLGETIKRHKTRETTKFTESQIHFEKRIKKLPFEKFRTHRYGEKEEIKYERFITICLETEKKNTC